MTRVLATVLVLLAAPWAYGQDDEYLHGRIRYLEPGVALQHEGESGAEEAYENLPFLPGDRVWTDGRGRAEFQFADGSLVRLDARAKLDYLAHEDGRGADRVVLSLWSGSLFLRVRDDRRHSDFLVETPQGRVEAREGGVYRVDVDDEGLRLSVYEGQAEVDTGRTSVTVREGERVHAQAGEYPGRPRRLDDDEESQDEFARWDRERGNVSTWSGDSRRYLPDEVLPYADDFDSYGGWYYEAEVGYVWRPRVAVGWQPYLHGRWCWTRYGWTWVPHERWGWASSHYGRWGHSGGLGWYWIPGRSWGPAWVSWSVGSGHVGWCALGRHDRPVFAHGDRNRGQAHRRGLDASADRGWVFARRGDLTASDIARRRVGLDGIAERDLRAVEGARARLTRDLRVADADAPAERAARRQVSTRPSPGDTVPELRADPATTIPSPILRRRLPDDARYERGERATAAGGETPRAREPATRRERDAEATRTTWRTRVEPDPPASSGTPSGGDEGRPAWRSAPARERRGQQRDSDDGDVLGRFFQPLIPRESGRAREGSRDSDSSTRRYRPAERDDSPSPSTRGSGGRRGGSEQGTSERRAPEPRAPERVAPRSEPRSTSSPRRDNGATPRAVPRKPKDKDR